MDIKAIICADVIARYGERYVLVERLGTVKGLSLPGGKQEPGELLSDTVRREFREETGLRLTGVAVFGTYADLGRDPRGHYVSTVFTGVAHGRPRDERGKTKVWISGKNEIESLKDCFVFDHYRILEQYFLFLQK